MTPSDGTTLKEARDWLRVQVVGDGADCPCCTQFAKVYRRSLNSSMARSLVIMYREHGVNWQDKIATLKAAHVEHAADDAKLRYWGLNQEDDRRTDDGRHAGWWRVTAKGGMFVRGLITVPKYAIVFDTKCLGLDGPQVTIRDCLGDRFNLRELMRRPMDGDNDDD